MTGKEDNPTIHSFSEFLAALELEDESALHESLEDEFEPFFAWAEINAGDNKDIDEGLEIVIFHDYNFGIAWLELDYPFALSDWYEQVNWHDDFQDVHYRSWEACSDDDAILGGLPDGEGDVTESVADWLGVPVGDLRNLLNGRWVRFEGPEVDYNGKAIHGWFAPTSSSYPNCALGLGGDAVYLEPVTYTDEREPVIAEWPVPVLEGPYYEGTFKGFKDHPKDSPLAYLREEVEKHRPRRRTVPPRPRS